jgi:hypothetical protein
MRQCITAPLDNDDAANYDWAIEVMDAMSIALETICENGIIITHYQNSCLFLMQDFFFRLFFSSRPRTKGNRRV